MLRAERPMVTIADVAARAGVGAGTVSRVLNDSSRVSPDTRSRVVAAMRALDYRPNPLARGLSRGRSQTVGLVMPLLTRAGTVERLRGVIEVVSPSHFDLVLFSVTSPAQRNECFASLTRRDRAAGLLVLSLPPTRQSLLGLRRAAVPVVLVGTCASKVASVLVDDVEGGRVATHHLVSLGHRRIAFIGEEPAKAFDPTPSEAREQGYRDALAVAGVPVRASLVAHGPQDRIAARRLAALLLAQRPPPTAVFASSDVQALGALEAAREAGLSVPDDVSVIGFDDLEVSAYADITTVRQPLAESGRLGAQLLIDALDAEALPEAGVRTLPLELVERSTTAVCRRRVRRR